MIATTLEQSKKLVEIGINTNTADMFWMLDSKDYYELIAIPYNESGCDKDDGIPAWSFDALFNVLPMYIGDFSKALYYNDGYYCAYFDGDALENEVGYGFMKTIEQTHGNTTIDAVFKMVAQLKKENFI